MPKLTLKEACDKIRSTATDGRIFYVRFRKRTPDPETGKREVREMTCRLGVKSHLKGGERAYDFEEKGLIPVFDMGKQDYRVIATEGLLELRMNGEWFEIVQPKKGKK